MTWKSPICLIGEFDPHLGVQVVYGFQYFGGALPDLMSSFSLGLLEPSVNIHNGISGGLLTTEAQNNLGDIMQLALSAEPYFPLTVTTGIPYFNAVAYRSFSLHDVSARGELRRWAMILVHDSFEVPFQQSVQISNAIEKLITTWTEHTQARKCYEYQAFPSLVEARRAGKRMRLRRLEELLQDFTALPLALSSERKETDASVSDMRLYFLPSLPLSKECTTFRPPINESSFRVLLEGVGNLLMELFGSPETLNIREQGSALSSHFIINSTPNPLLASSSLQLFSSLSVPPFEWWVGQFEKAMQDKPAQCRAALCSLFCALFAGVPLVLRGEKRVTIEAFGVMLIKFFLPLFRYNYVIVSYMIQLYPQEKGEVWLAKLLKPTLMVEISKGPWLSTTWLGIPTSWNIVSREEGDGGSSFSTKGFLSLGSSMYRVMVRWSKDNDRTCCRNKNDNMIPQGNLNLLIHYYMDLADIIGEALDNAKAKNQLLEDINTAEAQIAKSKLNNAVHESWLLSLFTYETQEKINQILKDTEGENFKEIGGVDLIAPYSDVDYRMQDFLKKTRSRR